MNPLLSEFESHRSQLRRLMAARIGQADADDVMQELFLKLAAVSEPQEIRDAANYVFRLAFNLASSWRRGAQRRERREDAWSRDAGDLGGPDVADEAASPEQALIGREELANVLRRLRALPPRTQEVFELHKLRGLSYAEVAERLGVSRSAIEKHMMRALSALSAVRER